MSFILGLVGGCILTLVWGFVVLVLKALEREKIEQVRDRIEEKWSKDKGGR